MSAPTTNPAVFLSPCDAQRDLFRKAAKATHPDAGGTDEAFARVARAMRYIEEGFRD